MVLFPLAMTSNSVDTQDAPIANIIVVKRQAFHNLFNHTGLGHLLPKLAYLTLHLVLVPVAK